MLHHPARGRSWVRSIGARVSFLSMSRSRFSTVTPPFSNSIICLTLNRACSPTMASLKMLLRRTVSPYP